MSKQEKIIVIGHKNPDTDSICSAIAYADIKNRTDLTRRYTPRRAGQINEETQFVLNYFQQEPPAYVSNIGTQVKDMDIHVCRMADRSMSLKTAWEIMQEDKTVTLPVTNSEGELEGIITVGDIVNSYMNTTDSYLLSNARTQYRRIAETIGTSGGHGADSESDAWPDGQRITLLLCRRTTAVDGVTTGTDGRWTDISATYRCIVVLPGAIAYVLCFPPKCRQGGLSDGRNGYCQCHQYPGKLCPDLRTLGLSAVGC